MTSNDVTRVISKTLGVSKVGHTGTLDPGAAGVLPICLGKATRVADYLLSDDKTYRCEMNLGVETDTLDAYGTIISQSTNYPNESAIMAVLSEFLGDISQTPPAYSALKIDGDKLYDLARKGIIPEIMSRTVTIKRIEIVNYTAPKRLMIEVDCSKGTYIRSLCKDIGRRLGCGAYMAFLLRISSGEFILENSHTLDEIKDSMASSLVQNLVIPMEEALNQFEKVIISNNAYTKAINGNPIAYEEIQSVYNLNLTGLKRIFCGSKFVGVGRIIPESKIVVMEKVLV